MICVFAVFLSPLCREVSTTVFAFGEQRSACTGREPAHILVTSATSLGQRHVSLGSLTCFAMDGRRFCKLRNTQWCASPCCTTHSPLHAQVVSEVAGRDSIWEGPRDAENTKKSEIEMGRYRTAAWRPLRRKHTHTATYWRHQLR